MLVDGKWTDAWQPVQATDAKGGFVRQEFELPQLGHAGRRRRTDGRSGLPRREGTLPSLRRADLSVGDRGSSSPAS